MEMDMKKCCPIVDVDGFIEAGKQFDLDIQLPEDNRDVIYGIVRDCYKEPVKDAVVKLVEVIYDCGKEIRRPVTHTFTDKEGEFVLGPLCKDKFYALQIFVNRVKHVKACAKFDRDTDCLKGTRLDKCDCIIRDCKKCEDKWEDNWEDKKDECNCEECK